MSLSKLFKKYAVLMTTTAALPLMGFANEAQGAETDAHADNAPKTSHVENAALLTATTNKAYSATTVSLQNNLIALGYDVGKKGADGYRGNDTNTALAKLAADRGVNLAGTEGEVLFRIQDVTLAALNDTLAKTADIMTADDDTKETVQKYLKGLGLYSGNIDAVIGPKSLAALAQVTNDKKYIVTTPTTRGSTKNATNVGTDDGLALPSFDDRDADLGLQEDNPLFAFEVNVNAETIVLHESALSHGVPLHLNGTALPADDNVGDTDWVSRNDILSGSLNLPLGEDLSASAVLGARVVHNGVTLGDSELRGTWHITENTDASIVFGHDVDGMFRNVPLSGPIGNTMAQHTNVGPLWYAGVELDYQDDDTKANAYAQIVKGSGLVDMNDPLRRGSWREVESGVRIGAGIEQKFGDNDQHTFHASVNGGIFNFGGDLSTLESFQTQETYYTTKHGNRRVKSGTEDYVAGTEEYEISPAIPGTPATPDTYVPGFDPITGEPTVTLIPGTPGTPDTPAVTGERDVIKQRDTFKNEAYERREQQKRTISGTRENDIADTSEKQANLNLGATFQVAQDTKLKVNGTTTVVQDRQGVPGHSGFVAGAEVAVEQTLGAQKRFTVEANAGAHYTDIRGVDQNGLTPYAGARAAWKLKDNVDLGASVQQELGDRKATTGFLGLRITF